jgi:osmotically-inducible protein OsmY
MVRTIFFLAILLISGVGCATQNSGRDSGAAVSEDDRQLTELVYKRLSEDPVTSKASIGVQCRDGIVTLIGRIDNAPMQMRVVSVVRGTTGVRGVIDKTFRY